MPRVTDEQIEKARQINLLSWLQAYEPGELVKDRYGPHYRTATHGSLVVRNDGRWYWNRGGFGGVSALDFLVKMRGVGFVEAVEILTGERTADARSYQAAAKSQPPPQYEFYPPKSVRYSNGAVAYLQGRGISPEVVNRCIQAGILYEGRYYNPKSDYHNAAVCVFAGKDASGEIRFAAMRGIDTDMKQDKAGSDKRYSFHLPAKNPDSRHLAVFESPIDALSHATLQKRDGWEWDGHRLSLGGTSDVALIAYLSRNPQISRVILHLDGDAAGIAAARRIKAALAADSRFSHLRVSVNPARGGKDFNEALLHVIRREREQRQQSRREAAISIWEESSL